MEKHIPLRRCVGCMRSLPQQELLRIVMTQDGPRYDAGPRSPGRGSYICRSRKCFGAMMKKNALAKAYRRRVTTEDYERLESELPLTD